MNALLRSALPAALLSLLAPAAVAQGFFQDGDIVVSSTVWDGSSHNGRIKLYRNGQFSDILHNGVIGFARTGDIIIDQQGRVVFLATGCAGNGNNSHLIRFDPETGVAESLVCFPYFGGNIPAGLPPDALGVGIVNGLHSTRILRVVIDDDVNNGVPQVSTTEAYGFSAPIARPNNVWEKLAFRYRVEDGVIEPGVDTGLLPLFGNVGAEMATRGRETWYAFENTIGFADPTLDVQVALRTVVEGFEVSLSGNLRLAGRNEIVMSGPVLDNTDIPNITVTCGNITDENVPLQGSGFNVLSGITEIGFLGDVLFATSNSGAAGRPWLFNLAGRGPFLNPYICQFYGAVQHAGPFVFGEGADASNTCVDGNLVYVCQDAPGRIITVSPTSWSVLAGGLSRPGGIAVYPPPTPPITSGAVVLRIDAGDDSGEGTNANVLLVDDLGRRLGRLPNGDAVNDFGAGAVALDLGPGGAVRVYAIVDPAPGTFDVQVAGTQAGPYALRGYLADTALGGAAVSVSGQAQPGVIEARTLRLTGPLDLAFGVPCPADFNDDGALTTSDISAFLVAWFSDLAGGTAAADFNADGSVTTSDISAFLAAWFQGLTDC